MEYPDITELINDIQRSDLKDNKALVCKAVQEYYKHLNSISAIRIKKEQLNG